MPATNNPWSNTSVGLESVPKRADVVVPHDTTVFTYACRALWVGVGGDVVAILNQDGADVARTFKNVPSGTLLPGVFHRVNATGTTATDMVGLS